MIVVTKELIAEIAITKWATGDRNTAYKMLEDEHTEEEVKVFLEEHGTKIDDIEDRLVEIVAQEVKL